MLAIVVVAISAMCALLTALWARRRIQAPVDALIEGTRTIARGGLDHRVSVSGRDELANLAVSFNWMMAELERRRSRAGARAGRPRARGAGTYERAAAEQRNLAPRRPRPAPHVRRHQPCAAHAADRDPRRGRGDPARSRMQEPGISRGAATHRRNDGAIEQAGRGSAPAGPLGSRRVACGAERHRREPARRRGRRGCQGARRGARHPGHRRGAARGDPHPRRCRSAASAVADPDRQRHALHPERVARLQSGSARTSGTPS